MGDPGFSRQKAPADWSAGLQWQQQQQPFKSHELAFLDAHRFGASQVYPIQHLLPMAEGLYQQAANSSRMHRPQDAPSATNQGTHQHQHEPQHQQQYQQHQQHAFVPHRVSASNYQSGPDDHLNAGFALDHPMPQVQQPHSTSFVTSASAHTSAYSPLDTPPTSLQQGHQPFAGPSSHVQHAFADSALFPVADAQGSSSRTRSKFSAAIDVHGGLQNGNRADGTALEQSHRPWLPSGLSQSDLPLDFDGPYPLNGPMGDMDGHGQQSMQRRASMVPGQKSQRHSQQRSPRHRAENGQRDANNPLASDQARAEEILKQLRSRAPDSKEGIAACDYCRKRKIRCDRTKPTCGRCATAGRYCTTSDALRKRGPPSKKEREFLAAQGIQFLPSRVRRRSSAVEGASAAADGPSSSQPAEGRRYSAADLASLAAAGSKSTGRSRDASNSSTGQITPASWSPASANSPFIEGTFQAALEQTVGDRMLARPSPRLHFEHIASGMTFADAGADDAPLSKVPVDSMQQMPALARTANRRPMPLNLQLLDRGGGSSMSEYTSGSDSSQEPWTALSTASSFDTWSHPPSSASFPPPSAHSAGFDAPVFLDHNAGTDYNALPASR